jgi:hypothetical protein
MRRGTWRPPFGSLPLPAGWRAFGAAVRAFYGLKENGNGKRPASVVVTESGLSVPINCKHDSELLVKVRQLMESANISEPEFIAVFTSGTNPGGAERLVFIGYPR